MARMDSVCIHVILSQGTQFVISDIPSSRTPYHSSAFLTKIQGQYYIFPESQLTCTSNAKSHTAICEITIVQVCEMSIGNL